MPENTKPSMPEIWLGYIFWLIFHSLSLISHSGALHCKAELKSHITPCFGTEAVHERRPGAGCAEVLVSSCINLTCCWHSQTGAVKHTTPYGQVHCAIEKSAPPCIFRMFPFLFRTLLFGDDELLLEVGQGKLRYGFDLRRSQKSGAAASGRCTIPILVRNRGCEGPSSW